MSIQLTKDSDILICLIYKNYKEQLKDGTHKSMAKIFGGYEDIQKTIAPKWTPDRVEETLYELSRATLLTTRSYDNHIGTVILNDAAIIYMENRFKDNVKELLDYIDKFKNILPI